MIIWQGDPGVDNFGDHTFSAHPEWDTNDVNWVNGTDPCGVSPCASD
jgi:hypothetical protein